MKSSHKNMFKPASVILTLALLVTSLPAAAQDAPVSAGREGSPYAINQDPNACWREAAQYHGVDLWLLYSIALVESNMNPRQIGRNKNGSLDLGMMQINTIWLNELSRYGITSQHLMDTCTSVYVGAWIMSKNFRTYGRTWRAIGAYNSGNPSIGYNYARKVYATHHKLTGLPTTYVDLAGAQSLAKATLKK